MVPILIDLNRLANIIAMPHTFVFKRYINLGLYRFMESASLRKGKKPLVLLRPASQLHQGKGTMGLSGHCSNRTLHPEPAGSELGSYFCELLQGGI